MHRLQHDNRVVHEHAHAQGHPAQRHDVERDVGLVHGGEGRHHRDRDRRRDDRRAAAVLQEHEEHERREQSAENCSHQDVVHALADELRLVEHDRGLGPLGIRGLLAHRVQQALHVPRHGDRVRVPLFEDRHFDALFAVVAGDDVPLLRAAPDLGDVLQQRLATPAVGNHDPAHFVDGPEFVDHAHHVGQVEVVEASASLVQILLSQDVGDLSDRDAQFGDAPLVDLDADLLLSPADDLDSRHPFDGLQALLELALGDIPQLGQRKPAVELQAQDGVVRRIEAQDDRALRVLGELDEIELLSHVGPGHVHGGGPIELEDNLGLTGAGYRTDPVEARHRAHRLLDRARDERLDFLGSGVFVIGLNG